MIKIATAQYEFFKHKSLIDYKEHVKKWVLAAVAHHASVLVFPEYGSIELVSLFNRDIQKNLNLQIIEMQKYLDEFIKLYQSLAKEHAVLIIAPSFPVKNEDESIINRAFIFFPNGEIQFQDKLTMTRFEDEEWKVSSPLKPHLHTFEFGGMVFGISICFDVEFPDYARSLALKGVDVLIAPSCTETIAGCHRVHIGAKARALENQYYVIVSQTVGKVDYSEAIDNNIGFAAVYSTCDRGFPDDGIISIGKLNEAQWVYAELDKNKIKDVRENGAVLNFKKISSIKINE